MPGTSKKLPRRTRKNVRLDQAKLTRARRILGVATETEAIERALDIVVERENARRASEPAPGTEEWKARLSPDVRALLGIAAGSTLGIDDYHEHLWQKYMVRGG